MVRHTTVGWKSYISVCFCCRLYMLWLNFNITNKFWVQLWYRCCCASLRTDHETSTIKHNGNLVFASPGPTEAMQTHPLCHLILSVRAKKELPRVVYEVFSTGEFWLSKFIWNELQNKLRFQLLLISTLFDSPFLCPTVKREYFSGQKRTRKRGKRVEKNPMQRKRENEKEVPI